MGNKLDILRDTARFLGESILKARKLAADEISRRSSKATPWSAPRVTLEKLLRRRRTSPPSSASVGKNEPPAPTEAEIPDKQIESLELPESEIAGIPEQTSESGSTPLSSNPWIDLLSRRSRNCLDRAGITTLEALQAKSAEDLLALPAFGMKCLSEVDSFLEANAATRTAAPEEPISDEGFFPEETVGFEDLQERTRSILRQIGIGTAEELRAWGLREILEAADYEEPPDELGILSRLTRPPDKDDLLALLVASGTAREALARVSAERPHGFFDKTMDLEEQVRGQVERGTLHERAGMDWAPLQALNHTYQPPADTLSGLLERLQHRPESKILDIVSRLDVALGVSSLDDELEWLFSQVAEREAEVIRQRLNVGHRRTLEQVGAHFNVTRERIRQIEKQAATQLRQAYYWELPLLRIRTAMLLIRENQLFAIPDMVRFFTERGLETSEQDVRDLLVIWRALDLANPEIHDSLVQWKVIDPNAYAFPEEILSVARTGLTPRQQTLSKDVVRIAHRTASRVGVATTGQIAEALNLEDSAAEVDILAILSRSGFQKVLPGHWASVGEGYSIPREVVSKMLSVCGSLNLRQLRRGLLRHQKRLGFYVPPIAVLGPLLAHQAVFEVSEDGICSFKNPDLHSPRLGLAEQVWVETAKTHGPVVHSHTILREFKAKNLEKVTAHRLMASSPLVEKVGKQLFSLPGADITDAGLEAGREQAILSRSGPNVVAPQAVQPVGEPALPDSQPLRDDSLGILEPLAGEAVRVRLQYEAAENRLSMTLPETTWQGDVSVRLSWDGREIDLPSAYKPSEDVTMSATVNLPVREPLWETEGFLVAGKSLRAVRFPRPPLDHGLVFRTSDGNALGRWRTSEEHYVVLPTERMSEEQAAEIFEEWHSLGRPEGWEAFTVLWVRTKDPLGQSGALERRADAAAVIDTFSRATRSLGLPDFDSLWRPRPRLVGGGSLGIFEGRETFTTDQPPYLEVNGLWDSALEVSLSRRIPGSVEFVREASLRLPPLTETNCLVEIWNADQKLREGRYRAEIGNQGVEFEIASSVPLPVLSRPTVDLAVRSSDGSLGKRALTRRELERANLVGRAWPGARLIFTAASGPWSHTQAVTADDEGNWSARWRDLGISAIPDGLLSLELSWRGLIGSELIVADDPFILKDDIDVSLQGGGPEKAIAVSGIVSNVGYERLARVVVLGARPWAGEIWTQEVRLDERGAFEARLQNVHGEICWLLILPSQRASELDARRPWFIQALSENTPRAVYPLERLQGERPDVWEELVNELRAAPLHPALARLIELSDLGRVLGRIMETAAGESRWMPVEKSRDLRRFLSWQRFGMRAPVAVFSPATPVTGKPPSDQLPPLLTVGLAPLTESLNRGVGELPLDCLTHGGQRRRAQGSLVLNESDNSNGFELHVEEVLHGCPRCGLILPPGEFWNHDPPGEDMPPCNTGRRALQIISAGRTKPVTLLMNLDTDEIAASLKELARRVVTGDEDGVPAHAEPWLDLLQEVYFEEAGGQEPEVWLDALYSVHARVRSTRQYVESEVELANLGRFAHQHESGLDVLSRWLHSEVE